MKKTRFANLIVLSLTAFSWFILGIWYGIGYCPCTDWHWQIRKQLGFYDMPNSYIKFLIDAITGLDVNAQFVDTFTAGCFIFAVLVSVYTNAKDKNFTKSNLLHFFNFMIRRAS